MAGLDVAYVSIKFDINATNAIKTLEKLKAKMDELEKTAKKLDKSSKSMEKTAKSLEKMGKTGGDIDKTAKAVDNVSKSAKKLDSVAKTTDNIVKSNNKATKSVNQLANATEKAHKNIQKSAQKSQKSLSDFDKKLLNARKNIISFNHLNYKDSGYYNIYREQTRNMIKDVKELDKARKEGLINEQEYFRRLKQSAKANNFRISDTGMIVHRSRYNDVSNAVNKSATAFRKFQQAQALGIPITKQMEKALAGAVIGQKQLKQWSDWGIVTQAKQNQLHFQSNQQLAKLRNHVNGLSQDYVNLNRNTNYFTRSQRMQNYAMQAAALKFNMLRTSIGFASGMVMGTFVNNFIYARQQSFQLAEQTEQMFKAMKHLGKNGKKAFQEFNKELDKFVTKFPKVNKAAVGSAVAQVGKLNKLSLNQMKNMIPVTADIINMMTINGRTMEDAVLALNDAFDGQFKRLQEIGINGKEELIKKYGWDGKTADSLIKALQVADKDMGWSDLTAEISTTSDALTVLGNCIDRMIVPVFRIISPYLVKLSVGVHEFVTWISQGNTPLKAFAVALGMVGASFAYMKGQILAARLFGSDFMANLSGLNKGMGEFNKALAKDVIPTTNAAGKVLKHNTEKFNMLATAMANNHIINNQLGTSLRSLPPAQRQLVVYNQMQKIAYEQLTRTQKMHINAVARARGITRLQALEELFGKDAIIANRVALEANNVIRERSIALTFKEAIAKGTNINVTELSTAATIKAVWAKRSEVTASNGGILATIRNTVTTVANTAAKIANAAATNAAAAAGAAFNAILLANPVAAGLAIAALTALAVAYATVGVETQKTAGAMKQYHDFLQNGDQQVKKLKDSSNYWSKKESELRQRLKTLTPGTQAYIDTEKAIARAHENAAAAARQATAAEEELKRVREVDQQLTAEETASDTRYREKFMQKMKEHGLDTSDAYTQSKFGGKFTYQERIRKDALDRQNRIRGIAERWQANILDRNDTFAQNAKQNKQYITDRMTAMDEISQGVKTMTESDSQVERFIAWLQVGFLRIKIFIMDLQMAWDNFWRRPGKVIGEMLQPITSWFGWLGGQISGFFKWVDTGIMSTVNGIIGWFTNLGAQVSGALNGAWTWITTGFTNIWTWLTTTFNTYFGGLITSITNIPMTIYNIFTNVATTIWNTISGIFTSVSSIFMNGIAVLSGFGTQLWNSLRSTFMGIYSTITGIVKNIWNKATGTWNNLVSSFTSGAKNLWDSVMKWVNKLWNDILGFIDFIKNPFGGKKPGSAGGSKKKGSAGGYAGPGIYRGATRSPSSSLSGGSNKVFAGIGNAIKRSIESITIGYDPLMPLEGYAGALKADNRPAQDSRSSNPFYCSDPKRCYGGQPFTNWTDIIKGKINELPVNIKGQQIKVQDIWQRKFNTKLFEVVARSLIQGTRYEFYYGDRYSNKEALQRGAFNCYDGAQILIDLARGLGLNAGMAHGYWGSNRHVWAVVEGKAFDTTAFQHGYGWTSPKVRAAGTSSSTENKSVINNINIEISGTVNGIEDLESAMKQVADRTITRIINNSAAHGL